VLFFSFYLFRVIYFVLFISCYLFRVIYFVLFISIQLLCNVIHLLIGGYLEEEDEGEAERESAALTRVIYFMLFISCYLFRFNYCNGIHLLIGGYATGLPLEEDEGEAERESAALTCSAMELMVRTWSTSLQTEMRVE
jgi:Kef-type K+ transport system membrane component KefB